MTKAANETTLALAADDPGALSAIADAVAALLARGREGPRLIIRLSGETLPDPLVSALVAGLRRLRDRGGAIAVEPLTPALRDAMALYGLDRVFALPLDPDATPRARRRGWFPHAAVAGLALLALIAPLLSAPSVADDRAVIDPAAVVARVIERNPELSSYQGRMHVDIRLLSFPFIRQHLDATTYYKRPSNYEVVFDRVPSYARGFEKLYTDIGDPANWEKRFVITSDGFADFEHHTDLALHMVQRVRGMIDHETVLVDPATWTIDQIRYDYYNGGSITMSQSFRSIGGYLLLASQRADIAIPHVRAVANGTYSDYQTNVAVDDAVFRKN
jgi:hypothetical protein